MPTCVAVADMRFARWPGAVHQAVVRLADAVRARDVLEHDRGLDLGGAHAIGGRAGRRRDVRDDLRAPHLLGVAARDRGDALVPRRAPASPRPGDRD